MSVGTAVRNPRAFVGTKWTALKVLFTDPERYFEDRPSSGSLRSEITVLVIVGLAGTAGMYYAASTIMSNFYTGNPPASGAEDMMGISGDVGIQIYGYAFRGLVGIFLLWIGFATALYAVSWLYTERGSYFGVLKQTAMALVPMFFANLVKSVGVAVAAFGADIEATEQDLIQSTGAIVDFLYGQILGEPVALAGMALSIVFIGYSGYLSAYAIAAVREIPIADAYKVAAVPTALYVLWVLRDIARFAGVL